jgi:hypothetical protein
MEILKYPIIFFLFLTIIFFYYSFFIDLQCLLPILLFKVNGVVGRHIFRKRRLLRFCLGISRTSQLFETIAKDKATVDVYGVCYIPLYTFV